MKTLSVTFDWEELFDVEVTKSKCLMVQIIESHGEALGDNISTFYIGLSQATKDSKSQDMDSTSNYQVKNLVNYSSTGKPDMFDHLCFDLSISNKENILLKLSWKILKKNSLLLRTTFLL